MAFWTKSPVIGAPTNVKTNYLQGTAKFLEVKRAYESCLQFGGVPVMGFGQGQCLVREAWKPYYTGTGICQALVNYWIADHASGSSLWTRLFNGTKFMPEAIIDIAKQQGLFGMPDGKGTSGKELQKIRSEAWLDLRGLNKLAPSAIVGGAQQDNRGWVIGQDICYEGMSNKPGGCYRMISLTSDTISHVVCAWVHKDIAYFDPNYGEFWFEKKDKFIGWFDKYWNTDTYNKNFDGYAIRDFAHRVGTLRPK